MNQTISLLLNHEMGRLRKIRATVHNKFEINSYLGYSIYFLKFSTEIRNSN